MDNFLPQAVTSVLQSLNNGLSSWWSTPPIAPEPCSLFGDKSGIHLYPGQPMTPNLPLMEVDIALPEHIEPDSRFRIEFNCSSLVESEYYRRSVEAALAKLCAGRCNYWVGGITLCNNSLAVDYMLTP